MPYGPEIRTGDVFYKFTATHNPTGIRAIVSIEPTRADGTTPTEAQRDTVFQSLLNKFNELPNVTINSATKGGNFVSQVTPSA